MDENVIIKDENNQVVESNKKLLWAVLASVGCALGGMAVWVGIAALGFYSAWIALLVVWLAKFGYERAKGPNTMAKFWTVLAVTIVVLLLSEYITLYVELVMANAQLPAESKLTDLNFWTTLPYTFKYINAFLLDLIFFVIFALLGATSTLIDIYRKVKRNKSKVSATNFNEQANDEYEQKFNDFMNDGKDNFGE